MKTALTLLLLSCLPAAALAGCDCDRCLAVYGDTRTGNAAHRKVVSLIAARRPAAVVHTGDLVPTGVSNSGWKTFRDITKGLRASTSFYAVLGNHERGGEDTFRSLFDYPGNGRWYAAAVPGLRLFMLDVLSPLGKDSPQYAWLDAELAKPHAEPFTAVALHYPPASSGRHGRDEWAPAAGLEALFRARGVDLVLAGHDHQYERLEKDGLTIVIAGGGGAPLRDQAYVNPYSRVFAGEYHYVMISVCGGALKGEVFALDDKLIDSFELKKRAP